MKEYDLVILGGGSAAFAAALRATELGAVVAVCEERVIGGTCLNRGCIPSKSLLRAAEVIHQAVLIVRGGMTVREIIEKIDVYPTLSEMVKLCAQRFYKDVKQLSCCAE